MKSRSETQIVIIELQHSVVLRGIKNKLEEQEYEVTQIGSNIQDTKRFAGSVDLFILYLSDTITDDPDNISLLNKMINEIKLKKQKLILIGEKDYMDEIVRKRPIFRGFKRFLLPIDIKELQDMIDDLTGDEEDEDSDKRILIVDDDPAYAKMVRGWIGEKYQTNIVTNGTQAITFLGKHMVDLILLDYEMPVVDGPKVLEMLRSEDEIKDIPVVFLTGVGTKESVQRVMSLGPAGYVLKTTTREDLLAKIKKVLASH